MHVTFRVKLKQSKLGKTCYVPIQYGKGMFICWIFWNFVLEEANGMLDNTEKSTLIEQRLILILSFSLTANRQERFMDCDGMSAVRVVYVMCRSSSARLAASTRPPATPAHLHTAHCNSSCIGIYSVQESVPNVAPERWILQRAQIVFHEPVRLEFEVAVSYASRVICNS